MSQFVEDRLSEADRHLINDHQLGSLLGIFRQNPAFSRFLRRCCQSLVLLGAVILALVIFLGIRDWRQSMALEHLHPHNLTEVLSLQEEQPRVDSNFQSLFSPFLAGVFGIIGGLLFLGIITLQTRRERVIACERGLLQVKWQLKDHVDVLHWEDVLAVEEALFGYTITCRKGEALTFELYQDIDELVAIIRQRSEVE